MRSSPALSEKPVLSSSNSGTFRMAVLSVGEHYTTDDGTTIYFCSFFCSNLCSALSLLCRSESAELFHSSRKHVKCRRKQGRAFIAAPDPGIQRHDLRQRICDYLAATFLVGEKNVAQKDTI